MSTKSNEQLRGAAFVAASYFLWGLLPVYWKLLQSVSATEVLCQRIIWCVVFMLLLIVLRGQWKNFQSEVQSIGRQPRKIIGIVMAAVFLNFNWGLYIWAVNQNHIIETSLGYYINPLVSVLLGMLVLKERLNRWQYVAFFMALLGVLNLTINFGTFPWIALGLAVSFGVYGLLKKMVGVGAVTGLTLETLIMVIPAIIYVTMLGQAGNSALVSGSPLIIGLLVGAGAVTGVPLLLFSAGALRLSLTLVGFLQYISPTLALLIGIYLYHEPFTRTHLISFILIWLGLTIFTVSQSGKFRRQQERAYQSS